MVQRKVDDRLQEIAFGDRSEAAKDGPKLAEERRTSAHCPVSTCAIGDTARGSSDYRLDRAVGDEGDAERRAARFILLLGIAAAVGVFVLTRTLPAVPAGFIAGFGLPFLVLRIKRTRRMRAFEEQFPEALDLIARALKAGHAFATG